MESNEEFIERAKVLNQKITDIWVVLDEENLEIWKDSLGNVRKFANKTKANLTACLELNMWIVVNVKFMDKFINHQL